MVVGNVTDEIKSMLKYVSKTNDECRVEYVIKKYIL